MMVSARAPVARRSTVVVKAAWTKVATKDELKAGNGRKVAEVNGSKYLIVEDGGKVYAVSNKCSHLGLPLQGKILSAPVASGCVTCAAHGTSFDLATGEVKGDWCPKLPKLPIIGTLGGNDKKPLPTFPVEVSAEGDISINI